MQVELGRTIDMTAVKKEVARHLVEQWGHRLVWKEKEEIFPHEEASHRF